MAYKLSKEGKKKVKRLIFAIKKLSKAEKRLAKEKKKRMEIEKGKIPFWY